MRGQAKSSTHKFRRSGPDRTNFEPDATLRRCHVAHHRAVDSDQLAHGGNVVACLQLRSPKFDQRPTLGRREVQQVALPTSMGARAMESATLQKWLVEQGCHIDGHEHHKRGEGPVTVSVHRDGRKVELPLGGSRQILDARIVRHACE